MAEKETEGYGKCPDCVWFGVEKGCNVKRDSELCLLNRQEKEKENGKAYKTSYGST